MERPRYRELDRKLRQAIEVSLDWDSVQIINSKAIISDLLELDVGIDELKRNLSKIFEEIKPKDYKGAYPPQRSYEDQILNCELLAFKWQSRFFGCPMYLKFAIKEDFLYLVSLHRDRPKRGCNNEMP
ncbi:MAG: hypothetical protein JRJ29_08600 [Deltaproteobacteria bacterium]|nr:hypothetical protein [Deltaproteobacteria bacterium]